MTSEVASVAKHHTCNLNSLICDMWTVGVECVLAQLLLVCFIAYL